MRLPQDLLTALNDQTTLERYSGAVYLAAAAQFEALALPGFAAWARRESDGEHGHARKFFDYITDRNETPVVGAVAAPDALRPDPLALCQAALDQERAVSDSLRALYALADELADPPTCDFLRPFLAEQVEAERDLSVIVAQLKRASGDAGALLFMDHEMGEGGK